MESIEGLLNKKKEVYLQILKLVKLLNDISEQKKGLSQSGGFSFNPVISETVFLEQNSIDNIIYNKLKLAKQNNNLTLGQAMSQVRNRHQLNH